MHRSFFLGGFAVDGLFLVGVRTWLTKPVSLVKYLIGMVLLR